MIRVSTPCGSEPFSSRPKALSSLFEGNDEDDEEEVAAVALKMPPGHRQEIQPGVPILVYLDPEDLRFQRKRLGPQGGSPGMPRAVMTEKFMKGFGGTSATTPSRDVGMRSRASLAGGQHNDVHGCGGGGHGQ